MSKIYDIQHVLWLALQEKALCDLLARPQAGEGNPDALDIH
jgi:hypothetical protein